jgi:site-specific recombinase XerD
MKRRNKEPLPATVRKFIATLQPTLRATTCYSYLSHLRGFHRWLKNNRVRLEQLDRGHITRWLIYRSGQSLCAITRNSEIVTVRMYLRWLYEQGIIDTHADELIRRTDLPKLPKYLPRPLAPEIDRQLLERLHHSHDPLHKVLLLTRKTGLRIGEVIRLNFDCIRTDYQGRRFLKVPLGKLHNERLVPLDDAAVELVEYLRRQGGIARPRLLTNTTSVKNQRAIYLRALRNVCQGLDIPDKMTVHRLRHTYATSLLSAGMSLTSVMKLLGHHDFRMTLRYADITQETVGKEYFEALAEIEKRYQTPLASTGNDQFNPVKAIADVIRWLKKNTASDEASKSAARHLCRRLERARKEILELSITRFK